ncbi:MAG: hypothetical protein WCJ18_00320 [Planctomycetota bacterium]
MAYLSDDLGCDHSVNICMCGLAGIVFELKLNLDGKRTCPGCSGEGFNYDQATHEAAKAKRLAEWGGEEWYDIGDNEGYIKCLLCASKGTVDFDTEVNSDAIPVV